MTVTVFHGVADDRKQTDWPGEKARYHLHQEGYLRISGWETDAGMEGEALFAPGSWSWVCRLSPKQPTAPEKQAEAARLLNKARAERPECFDETDAAPWTSPRV